MKVLILKLLDMFLKFCGHVETEEYTDHPGIGYPPKDSDK